MRVASSSSGMPVSRDAAKRRAESCGHDGRGQSLARHIGNNHQQAAVGLLHNVEIIAAHLVAGIGAEGDRVAGNLRQRLRQQRALNVPRRVQILLHSRELHIALVVAGIFKRHRRLQRQTFKEVGLVKRQFACRLVTRPPIPSSACRRGRPADRWQLLAGAVRVSAGMLP